MTKYVVLLAICAFWFVEDTPTRACDCANAQAVCLTDVQMASHVRHIAMQPDLMGNHNNGGGIAVFEITFGEDGKVVNAKAISGHPLAIHLLIGAAPKWRFRPFVQHGAAKQACGRLTVKFSIVENQTSVVVVQPRAG